MYDLEEIRRLLLESDEETIEKIIWVLRTENMRIGDERRL